MTVTNEQIQALKAAAEKAKLSQRRGGMEMATDSYDFIAMTTPQFILSLLAERDADKALIAELKHDVNAANARVDAGCAQLCNQDEEIEMLRQQVAELEESKANLEILYDANLCDMLPGPQYMDPPDGGQVEPIEQVARMVADYRQQIAEQANRIANLERALDLARNSNSVLAIRSELEARTLTVKLPDSIPCPTAPEIIWLQTNGDDSDESKWPESDDDVSWCREKIFTNDTLYVRADLTAAGITLVVGE